MKNRAWSLYVAAAVVCLAFWHNFPAQGQFGAGMQFGQTDLVRQVHESASALRQYYKKTGQMPRQQPELDEALKQVARKVGGAAGATQATNRGIFRVYNQFALAYDQVVGTIPVINGQAKIQNVWTNAWQQPVNTIVMLTDGANHFVVWAAGVNQMPVLDPNTNTPMIEYAELEEAEPAGGD